MKHYKDFLEALTPQQRNHRKAIFRGMKQKMLLTRARNANKIADRDTLEKRARVQARKAVESKLLKGQSKDELSFSQRQNLEIKVSKKSALIDKLAKKLFPIVKKAEIVKKTHNKIGDDNAQ